MIYNTDLIITVIIVIISLLIIFFLSNAYQNRKYPIPYYYNQLSTKKININWQTTLYVGMFLLQLQLFGNELGQMIIASIYTSLLVLGLGSLLLQLYLRKDIVAYGDERIVYYGSRIKKMLVEDINQISLNSRSNKLTLYGKSRPNQMVIKCSKMEDAELIELFDYIKQTKPLTEIKMSDNLLPYQNAALNNKKMIA